MQETLIQCLNKYESECYPFKKYTEVDDTVHFQRDM